MAWNLLGLHSGRVESQEGFGMTKTTAKPRRKSKPRPLGTIWEVPDALWEKILPILREFWPKKPTW